MIEGRATYIDDSVVRCDCECISVVLLDPGNFSVVDVFEELEVVFLTNVPESDGVVVASREERVL